MSPGSSLGRTGMATARLVNVQMWYDTRGQGDPLVALHPGGAGVDSRALARMDQNRARRGCPAHGSQRGFGYRDGETVASWQAS
jgi:hypothetical protein